MKKNKLATLVAVFIIGAFLPLTAWAAPSVFVECAYNSSDTDPGADLACYIYADTDGEGLISGGVNLSYDPGKLSVAAAEKNETDWFFGDGTTNHPYMNPEVGTSEIIFITGKLDTMADPQIGVKSSRALIGTVTFDRSDSFVDPGADPAAYFGIAAALGRSGDYVNFVNTAGTDRDADFDFGPILIFERGDANASGAITGADRSAIKFFMVNGGIQHPWMDCNADGNITGADRSCIKFKMTH